MELTKVTKPPSLIYLPWTQWHLDRTKWEMVELMVTTLYMVEDLLIVVEKAWHYPNFRGLVALEVHTAMAQHLIDKDYLRHIQDGLQFSNLGRQNPP